MNIVYYMILLSYCILIEGTYTDLYYDSFASVKKILNNFFAESDYLLLL